MDISSIISALIAVPSLVTSVLIARNEYKKTVVTSTFSFLSTLKPFVMTLLLLLLTFLLLNYKEVISEVVLVKFASRHSRECHVEFDKGVLYVNAPFSVKVISSYPIKKVSVKTIERKRILLQKQQNQK